jgi:hypothetical protein
MPIHFPFFAHMPSVRQVRPYGNKRAGFAEAVALSKAPDRTLRIHLLRRHAA